MKRKLLISVSSAFFLLAITSCTNNKHNNDNEIPKSISSLNCFWVGGKDGGYWVEVLFSNNRDTITANLFLQHSGDFFSKNIYVINDSDLPNVAHLPLNDSSVIFVSQNQFEVKIGNKKYTFYGILFK